MEQREGEGQAIEIRVLPVADVTLRQAQEDNGELVIEGHFAVFGAVYDAGWWGFTEEIARGAFDDVLGDDVRCLVNHDVNHLLGRTSSKTCEIGQDERGGWQRTIINPNDRQALDWYARIARGDLTGQSFAFTVREERWLEQEKAAPHRTILKVGQLFDVGPVTYPAYEVTNVDAALRSLDEYRARRAADARGGITAAVAARAAARRRRIDLARI